MQGGDAGVRTALRRDAHQGVEAVRNRAMVGEVFADCHRHTVRGYLRGFLDLPKVPRYRPPSDEVELAPWMPFE